MALVGWITWSEVDVRMHGMGLASNQTSNRKRGAIRSTSEKFCWRSNNKIPYLVCLLKEPVNTFNQSAHHAHKFCRHAGDVQTTPITLAFDDLMRWMAVEFMCNACGSRQLPFHAFVHRPHSKLSNPPMPFYIIMTGTILCIFIICSIFSHYR